MKTKLLAGGLTMMLFFASNAVAQDGDGGGESLECGELCSSPGSLRNCCPLNYHIVDRNGNRTGLHSNCMVNPGGHGYCTINYKQDEYLKLLAAANTMNPERILPLALEIPDYVYVNRVRRAIQIFSCTGSLIANIRYKDSGATLDFISRLENLQSERARLAHTVGGLIFGLQTVMTVSSD